MWWILGGVAIVGVYTFVWCLCQSAAEADKVRIHPVNPGDTTVEQRRALIARFEKDMKARAQMRVH